MERSFPTHHFLAALLTLFALISTLNAASAARTTGKIKNIAFIKTACTATLYPRLCFSSLSTHANDIGHDPKLLALAALPIAFDAARSTSFKMLTLSKSPGMKRREAAAMSNCAELLTDSVDQLARSIAEMKNIKGLSSKFELIMSDVQTWVSAALTDDEACMDGFRDKAINDKLEKVVSGRILKVAQLTSNALALIHGYATIHL